MHVHECKPGTHKHIHMHTRKGKRRAVWMLLLKAGYLKSLRQGWKGNERQGLHPSEQRTSLLEHSEGKGQATQEDMGSVQKSKAAGYQWGNLT